MIAKWPWLAAGALSSTGLSACIAIVGGFEVSGSSSGAGGSGAGSSTTVSSSSSAGGGSPSSSVSTGTGVVCENPFLAGRIMGDGGGTGTCASPIVLDDPSRAIGNTSGKASEQFSSGCNGSTDRSELVYVVTAAHGGVLDIWLDAESSHQTVYVRESCEDPGSQIGHCELKYLSVPVIKDQKVYVIVDSDEHTSGEFTIHVNSHEVTCGDCFVDEDCDPPDGESCEDCKFKSTLENEPNNDAANADPYKDGFTGKIANAADQDYVYIDVMTESEELSAEIVPFGNATCKEQMNIDTAAIVLDVFFGPEQIQQADWTVRGCGKITVKNPPKGRYYARVTSDWGHAKFAYGLDVQIKQLQQ